MLYILHFSAVFFQTFCTQPQIAGVTPALVFEMLTKISIISLQRRHALTVYDPLLGHRGRARP